MSEKFTQVPERIRKVMSMTIKELVEESNKIQARTSLLSTAERETVEAAINILLAKQVLNPDLTIKDTNT